MLAHPPEVTKPRTPCPRCARILGLCLCRRITPIEIKPRILILMHPKEYSKTTGTARIVHQSIRHSRILRGYGQDFDSDPRILTLLSDPNARVMLLYPGADSLNLGSCTDEELQERIPRDGKQLYLLIVDGTWSTAKRMIRTSSVLSKLPKISFQVHQTSRFQFKKQPKDFCLSTVEAVSLLIENLFLRGLSSVTPPGAHTRMLEAFEMLVATQLKFVPEQDGTAPHPLD